jgi:23S rRNA U2552 (ribose-2'-O)-methylase RlmE/FtsJ
VAEVKEGFSKTALFKPAASRPESREIFVVADGFMGWTMTVGRTC